MHSNFCLSKINKGWKYMNCIFSMTYIVGFISGHHNDSGFALLDVFCLNQILSIHLTGCALPQTVSFSLSTVCNWSDALLCVSLSICPVFYFQELDALVHPLGFALNKCLSGYPCLALSLATPLWRSLESSTRVHSNAILRLQWGRPNYKALGSIGVFGRLSMGGGAQARGPNIFSLNDQLDE